MNLHEKEFARIASQKTNQTSFIGRNVALNYLLLYLLYPIAAIYSAFTQGAALYVYLDRVINSALIALIFTVVVAIIIEIAKYFFGKAVSDDARQHVWTESREHVFAFVLKLVAFIGVFAFSITLSLTGAPDVAKDYRETSTPVQLVSTDSVSAYYDAKIKAERHDIAAGERMTWKGAIIADGRKIIRTAKANIKDYENQKAAALAETKAANIHTMNEYQAETEKAGGWLTGFAGLGEALALLILLFVSNYRSGAEKEVLTANNGQFTADYGGLRPNTAATTANNGAYFSRNQSVHPAPPVYTEPVRNPIGFQIPKQPAVNGGRYNGKSDVNGKTYPTANCEQCGSEYEKTVWNKKFCSETCKLDYHAAKHGKRFDASRYKK